MNKKSIDEFSWQNIYCYIDIKDFVSKEVSLCKYTWKIIVYIIITGKRRLCPNIKPKTCNQGTNIKDMILNIWYKEVIEQKKLNP